MLRNLCLCIIFNLVLAHCLFVSDMTENTFGNRNDGYIAAFGDFNSDELTDAFIINGSNVEVLLAYDKEPFFRPSSYSCNFSNFIVTSIVPGDFDGDAYMDILVTSQIQNSTSNFHEVRILWGGMPYLNCTDASLIKAITVGQPLVLDYNRDMILDLFGINAESKRVFWVFDKSRSTPIEILMSDFGKSKEIKLPHSHSFLDVNDDNAADLLVTTHVDVEIWLNEEAGGFRYNNSIELLVGHPTIYGQVLFIDVALSGQFFLVVPVCYDLECINSTILIYDNEQWHDLQVDLNDGKGTLWRFIPPRAEVYMDTITMRSGDFNMDGYPDILMTLSPVSGKDTKAVLLHNVPCNSPGCKFHRTFEVQWEKFNTFGKNVVMATFYDLYMDGVLDVLYVQKNITNTTEKYIMKAFRNELEYDTNFIKVIVVTGLSNERVPTINGTLYNRKVTFGTNLPGPKIGYNTWSQEGQYRTGVCAQLPQSAYFALQLPYSLFGLDRTPNFVDTLTVGLSGYSKSWTQIIPNSQIVLIPAPPNDPSEWRAQLFVTPSKVVLKSVFVLTAIIVIIIGAVSYLHWKERNDRQDIIEIDEKIYVKI
ncbi:T-cell immunomodulatory protein [Maniola jurtina]|uniref:T-cell immunomodulatory protein n=1 Tax=Maniola jurtina TaxID=191418 RepID=UPI001E68F368|nr:T-cell immunomodulatory protein [Maniola jurtina]XP_045785260.1 T-cell immunomodulatory protein [Maniola jurtina]